MNSWKSISFRSHLLKDFNYSYHLTEPLYDYGPEYHLLIGGNVIAKTTFIIKNNDNFIKPLFFLNIFDIPFTDFNTVSLKIISKENTVILKENELTFEPGHYLTKRNPDKEILIEYYDKSFPEQVNRNVLQFAKGQMGKMYIPSIHNITLKSKYIKLLNKMKY